MQRAVPSQHLFTALFLSPNRATTLIDGTGRRAVTVGACAERIAHAILRAAIRADVAFIAQVAALVATAN
jgi:hypothetical protein